MRRRSSELFAIVAPLLAVVICAARNASPKLQIAQATNRPKLARAGGNQFGHPLFGDDGWLMRADAG